MACETHCCVFTRGEFYIRNAVGDCTYGIPGIDCNLGASFRKVGNISSGLIEIETEIIGTENEFNLADPESRVEVRTVNLSLSLNCISKNNLLWAFHGEDRESDTGSYVEDFCINGGLNECLFFPFKYKGASSLIVYLRNDDGAVATLVESIDYLTSSSGIQIIRDDIDLQGATTLRLAYSYDTSNYLDIEFFSEVTKYKELYFKGINYGDDKRDLFDANFYRVIFPPVSQMDLITRDELLVINLSGKVEKQNGKWYKIIKQES